MTQTVLAFRPYRWTRAGLVAWLAASWVGSALATPMISLPPYSSGPSAPSAGAAYRQGLEHLLANRLPAAKSAFEAALKESPKAAGPALGLAEVAYRMKDLKGAE